LPPPLWPNPPPLSIHPSTFFRFFSPFSLGYSYFLFAFVEIRYTIFLRAPVPFPPRPPKFSLENPPWRVVIVLCVRLLTFFVAKCSVQAYLRVCSYSVPIPPTISFSPFFGPPPSFCLPRWSDCDAFSFPTCPLLSETRGLYPFQVILSPPPFPLKTLASVSSPLPLLLCPGKCKSPGRSPSERVLADDLAHLTTLHPFKRCPSVFFIYPP